MKPGTLRKNILRSLYCISFFIFLGGQAVSQSSFISSSVDSVSVGEVLNISLKVQLDKEYDRIIYPDSSGFPQEVELLSSQQYRITDFADSISYRVQFFGNKDLNIAPLQIGLISDSDTSYIYSNGLPLFFKTVLPAEDAELKPMKPIFDFKGFPWAAVLIAIAVLVAAYFVYRILTKKEPEPERRPFEFKPFQNPLTELENSLSELKNEYDLAVTKDFKFFYSTLSDSIRAYFEELYNIPALESTTRELMRFLDAFGVDIEMVKQTRTILNRSDMVKFAKFTPTLDDAWDCYQTAIDFVDRARLVDASRISRKKQAYEASFRDMMMQHENEVPESSDDTEVQESQEKESTKDQEAK